MNMSTIKKMITGLILVISLFPYNLLACQYNVRETGFADFETNHYRFYGFVNQITSENIVKDLDKACLTIFNNCNINYEIINIETQNDHSALHYINQLNIDSFPFGIIVSPDSHVIEIPFPIITPSYMDKCEPVIKSIVESPIRNEIIKKVIKTYGVILIIEGIDKQENQRILKKAKQAIHTIQTQMKFMPKIIKHAPELIVLKRKSFDEEKLLLWSLGLNGQKIKHGYAAIIYGKTRWFGPLLKDKEITKTNLSNILYIIGQDCECGLDMDVMKGTRLLVKWDEKRHRDLVKNLGYDPENPMVKLEMSRILRKGLSGQSATTIYSQSEKSKINRRNDPLYVVDDQPDTMRFFYYLIVISVVIILISLLIIYKKVVSKV